MANELTVHLTAKVVKVTANVEIHTDTGQCVGTTTVDLTPKAEAQQTPLTDGLRLHDLQQTSHPGART